MTGLDQPARPGGGARPTLDDRERARRDALAGRLLEAGLGFNDLHAVYLGDRLGLYGRSPTARPAHRARARRARPARDERYVREWLEHQAVADPRGRGRGAAPGERRYRCPAGHARSLLDRDSLAYMAPFARMMVGDAPAAPAGRRGVPHRRRRAVR